MTHEQLQAAQRAALSLGLNVNSEQAAAIINAALRAQWAAVPECPRLSVEEFDALRSDYLQGLYHGKCDMWMQWENAIHAGAAAPQHAATQAARDVLAERRRQVEAEGWTPEHDDQHDAGELAVAAGCYAIWAGGTSDVIGRFSWKNFFPWDWKWWKPSGSRRNLVKAGALILAEVERLDRAAGKDPSHV